MGTDNVVNMTALDGAMLFLRVVVGLSFFAHGVRHARTQEGTARWFERVGFKMAPLQARLAAFGELAAGAGLVVGLLTPIAAAAVVATMVTAAGSVHRFNGFFIIKEGWEYTGLIAITAVCVSLLGPGEWSLDHAIGFEDPPGVSGLVTALVLGAGGAAVLLALFWRPVEKKQE